MLQAVEELELRDTRLTEDALYYLRGLVGLKNLSFSLALLSDNAIAHLSRLDLQTLFLYDEIAPNQRTIDALRAALPNCLIWLQSQGGYLPLDQSLDRPW